MYKNESFYVQTLKRVKEELKRIEEEENILITFKKWALHPCSQGDWQIQYQNFPPSHPTEIKIVANLNQWNLILKESLGNFDMFRVLFWLRTIKELCHYYFKRTVSRDFLLLLFAWFSPIWIPYLYNKVHYMINMVSISKCKTLTHNYSITFKGFFSSMYKAAVSWHFGHSFFQD